MFHVANKFADVLAEIKLSTPKCEVIQEVAIKRICINYIKFSHCNQFLNNIKGLRHCLKKSNNYNNNNNNECLLAPVKLVLHLVILFLNI